MYRLERSRKVNTQLRNIQHDATLAERRSNYVLSICIHLCDIMQVLVEQIPIWDYSWRFASTAAHTAGLSREICQKVDVVWFEKLQSLWWSSQLEDNNVHLEVTAVLLGLQDLGGKLTTGSHIGVILGMLGPSLAILWVMLKLSRAMVVHAEVICQMLFGHVVGFVPQRALSPRSIKVLSGFWQVMLDLFGGQIAMEATFWAQIGAKLGHLGPRAIWVRCFYRAWSQERQQHTLHRQAVWADWRHSAFRWDHRSGGWDVVEGCVLQCVWVFLSSLCI